MLKLELFSRARCHLCDDALALLNALEPSVAVTVTKIDSSPVLLRRYGEKIPVVRRTDTDAELNWPFTLEELTAWIYGSG